ncbi:MAG: FliH/SctL family protein [Acidobacteriaceae bacterium]
MSSSVLPGDRLAKAPVRALIYRDMAGKEAASGRVGRSSSASGPTVSSLIISDPKALETPDPADAEDSLPRAEVEMSHAEFARRLQQERADAVREAEQRLRREYESRLESERAAVRAAIAGFAEERDKYFGRAETEIVQLTLAIAAKILHREAQVDPMLVATLVRMAVEKLREGSSARVRVSKGSGARWKSFFAAPVAGVTVEVEEDAGLSEQDCILETELGMANFGLDAQLKEVEQGFFDLMALRPGKGPKRR